MRSCEGFVDYNEKQSRYSMLKISLHIGSIALLTLAMADLTCMPSVNFESIVSPECYWEWNTIGKYFRIANHDGLFAKDNLLWWFQKVRAKTSFPLKGPVTHVF